MWVYTGISLVNITGAHEITIERETASDRLTVFTVSADFGDAAQVPLARIELVYAGSLIVSLSSEDAGPRLSPREQAERRARDECEACLRALAGSLRDGASYCDLSTLYTPVIMADQGE